MNTDRRNILNEILLRRRRKVLLEAGTDALPTEYVATFLKNFERLGFTVTPELLERLGTLSEMQIGAFHQQTLKALSAMVGAKQTMEPMYPNFPQQVMDASAGELYLNAIMHYLGDWIGARIMPVYGKHDRPPLLERVDLRVIELGEEAELAELCRNLIAANTSISDSDKADVAVLVDHFSSDISLVLPGEIPNKENLSFTASLLLEHDVASDVLLSNYFGTATDVLRLATALSGGDVSLAANTKFRSFKRRERRLLLSLLERCSNREEDMQRYRGRYKRLGERLHPGEYAEKYPKTAAAFAMVRSGQRVETFNSKVEAALLARDQAAALSLLQTRPGELARRLDHLMRMANAEQVLQAFHGCANAVATPVLLQVHTHFLNREDPPPVRAVFPKGNAGKVMALPYDLPTLAEGVSARAAEICASALVARFAERKSLGNVFVDPRLRDFVAPFSQRSASKALRTLVRGSRLPMPDGGTVRLFLWWTEGELEGEKTGRVDVDLSAAMYDENWDYKEHISYTNLKSDKYKAAHSGDITSAPNGACEFIDIDVASVLRYGGRYVVMCGLSFTGQPFSAMPEAFVGWMMRSGPKSGEVFEPSTVVDKLDLGAQTKTCIPLILDLETRELIWCDIALGGYPRWNNVEENRTSLIQMGKALSTLRKPNLFDLFTLHAAARGTIVETPDAADTVFSVEEGITPFDIELVMSEYLA